MLTMLSISFLFAIKGGAIKAVSPVNFICSPAEKSAFNALVPAIPGAPSTIRSTAAKRP